MHCKLIQLYSASDPPPPLPGPGEGLNTTNRRGGGREEGFRIINTNNEVEEDPGFIPPYHYLGAISIDW